MPLAPQPPRVASTLGTQLSPLSSEYPPPLLQVRKAKLEIERLSPHTCPLLLMCVRLPRELKEQMASKNSPDTLCVTAHSAKRQVTVQGSDPGVEV